jgi:hypothetical protein
MYNGTIDPVVKARERDCGASVVSAGHDVFARGLRLVPFGVAEPP